MAIGFILVVILFWKPVLQSKKPVESIPMLPDSHWIFGHLLWLLGNEYLVKQQILLEHADDQGDAHVGLVHNLQFVDKW
ncbi:hypothetical protein QTG54_002231 [Skeletonema marinoi]|uniref:Alpha-1,3-glucosyltransferase n=1 Tax=Skeletonema marinoi TaxID=267567 RepID=A0AAD8YKF0_9STRA|nr:hypothetical protein QTG54_002231 [Skeletonema marinoi]